MATSSTSPLYTLHVQLQEIEPPIWRRINVPGQISLFQLHQILQVSMGWNYSHLHEFVVEDEKQGKTVAYGEPSPEDDYYHQDEQRVRLAQIAPCVGSRLLYIYDLGDYWRHDIIVEEIQKISLDEAYPWLLDAERAAPPEDVGGVSEYKHF